MRFPASPSPARFSQILRLPGPRKERRGLFPGGAGGVGGRRDSPQPRVSVLSQALKTRPLVPLIISSAVACGPHSPPDAPRQLPDPRPPGPAGPAGKLGREAPPLYQVAIVSSRRPLAYVPCVRCNYLSALLAPG